MPTDTCSDIHTVRICQGYRPAWHTIQAEGLCSRVASGGVHTRLDYAHRSDSIGYDGVCTGHVHAVCHTTPTCVKVHDGNDGGDDSHHGVDIHSQPCKGLRMLRRCHKADQRRDSAQEHCVAGSSNSNYVAPYGHGQTNIEVEPMDCDQLLADIHRVHKRILPVCLAYVRLPSVSHRSQHQEGHGDTRRSRAAGV